MRTFNGLLSVLTLEQLTDLVELLDKADDCLGGAVDIVGPYSDEILTGETGIKWAAIHGAISTLAETAQAALSDRADGMGG